MPQSESRIYVPPGVGPGGSVTPAGPAHGHATVTADVAVQEGTGADCVIHELAVTDLYVHLYATDDPTGNQTSTGFSDSVLNAYADEGATMYTCERWVRLRFSSPYNLITRIRFWVPGTEDNGWQLNWGTSTTYQTPVATQSTIATQRPPTTDLFVANVGPDNLVGNGSTPVPDAYSDWIVLQASVSITETTAAGPMRGVTDGLPNLVRFNVAWGELR